MSGRSGVGVWMVLAMCAVLIVGGMAWLTRSVFEAERERSLAEARAHLEERIRLSLWRMDSLAAAVTIEENQRVLLPQAGGGENPLVRGRFRMAPDGGLEVLGELDKEDREKLAGLLDGRQPAAGLLTAIQGDNLWQSNRGYEMIPVEGPVQAAEQQQAWTNNERAIRGKAMNNAVSKAGLTQQAELPEAEAALEVASGGFQPIWIEAEPFLLRQVVGGLPGIEGVWLDREAFREMLLGEIADLLPRARLEPSKPGGGVMELASFPWRLVPGDEAVADPALRGPVVASLAAGWGAVIVALVAGLALVRGVMRLSERRASFVSAVTHELRTPLTTFRLYSDLLASGAVSDEDKRVGYFRTMRREADRLSHLVENVLAFSRIERKGGKAPRSAVDVGPLLEGLRERCAERLAGAGLDLEVAPEGRPVARADAAGIEHVVFNLVDNAAKYAAGSEPPVVTISARKVRDEVEIEVADHGPGISADERGRVFRAFHKSAAEAADSKPGVGLGLALSRRIARDLGGELECREGEGARFVLRLPAG